MGKVLDVRSYMYFTLETSEVTLMNSNKSKRKKTFRRIQFCSVSSYQSCTTCDTQSFSRNPWCCTSCPPQSL